MESQNLKLFLVVASIAVVSCQTTSKTPTIPQTEAANGDGITQTRVFLRDTCPLPISSVYDKSESSLGATIAGIIGPGLVESGLDIIGAAIAKIGGKDDETTTIEATKSSYFYRHELTNSGPKTLKNKKLSCIIFTKAVFGITNSETWIPEAEGKKALEPIMGGFNIVGKPQIYLQANVYSLANDSQVVIAPNYLWYGSRLNPKGRDISRDIQLRFSFTDPNKTDNSLISEGSIYLTDLESKKFYTIRQFAGISTNFLSAPSKGESFDAAVTERAAIESRFKTTTALAAVDPSNPGSIKQLDEEISKINCVELNGLSAKICSAKKKIRNRNLQKSVLQAKGALPGITALFDNAKRTPVYGGAYNISVQMVETRDINKWLVALGEAISSKKTELSSEISKVVFPSLKDAEKKSKTADEIVNQGNYLAALFDVEIKQEKLKIAEADGDVEKILVAKKELVAAKMAANSTAVTADKKLPYPGLL